MPPASMGWGPLWFVEHGQHACSRFHQRLFRRALVQGQHTGAGGGAAATLIAVILVALVTGNAFRRAIAEEQSHSILLARVIEDQATRTLDSGEMALDALAISPALRADVPDAAAIQAALNQTLSGLPFCEPLRWLMRTATFLPVRLPLRQAFASIWSVWAPEMSAAVQCWAPWSWGGDWLRSRWAPLR